MRRRRERADRPRHRCRAVDGHILEVWNKIDLLSPEALEECRMPLGGLGCTAAGVGRRRHRHRELLAAIDTRLGSADETLTIAVPATSADCSPGCTRTLRCWPAKPAKAARPSAAYGLRRPRRGDFSAACTRMGLRFCGRPRPEPDRAVMRAPSDDLLHAGGGPAG